MSRLTYTERGARMALEMAHPLVSQPLLFADALLSPQLDEWRAIHDAAQAQLVESAALRAALEASRAG